MNIFLNLTSLAISVLFFVVIGSANARTFDDNFDDQGVSNKWKIVMGNWEYILSSGTTDYVYQGVGTPEAASAADQGKSYLNDGLVISAVFNYTPNAVPLTTYRGAGVFFSIVDTGGERVGYSVKIDYADHNNDGSADYALRIAEADSYEAIDGALLPSANINTTFKLDIVVGTNDFNVILTDFTNGATMASISNLPLTSPNIKGGMVGMHSSDVVTLHSFSISGNLMSPSQAFIPTINFLLHSDFD